MQTAKTLHGPTKGPHGDRSAVLSGEASAILRNQLLAEIAGLEAHDDLDTWTLRAWPKANTLTPADGDEVRLAFQVRLDRLQTIPDELSPAERDQPTTNQEMRSRADKSLLAIPVPRRARDKAHLRFVANQPCLICGRQPSDPHHLRFAQSRGLGQKVSDEFTVPLCRAHHRELHRASKEVEWWARTGLEPTGIARKLWMETHPLRLSGNLPSDDNATPGSNVAEGAASIPPRTQMTKRIHLPGFPT